MRGPGDSLQNWKTSKYFPYKMMAPVQTEVPGKPLFGYSSKHGQRWGHYKMTCQPHTVKSAQKTMILLPS